MIQLLTPNDNKSINTSCSGVGNTGTACYAEFGMMGNNGNPIYLTCLMVGLGAPSLPPTHFGFGQDEVTGCSWGVGGGTGGTYSEYSP